MACALFKKVLPKKQCNRPYMNVELARALYEQNRLMGLRNIHLPDARSSWATRWMGLRVASTAGFVNSSRGADGPLAVPLDPLPINDLPEDEEDE
jgi:hypothetical protein